MRLTVINSGSKGNCYILHNEREALMLEAGAPFTEVLRAVGPAVCSRINGCLLSHEHGDHAKYVKDVLDHAIPVYATPGTIDALKGKQSKICRPVNFLSNLQDSDEALPWMTERIGGFMVLPFKTIHDAASPCGFFIKHADFGHLLFATDTRFIPNRFKDLTNIMIECNYDEGRLAARTDIPDSLKDRIRMSHQSIDTCIEALKANDLSKVCKIILIHISEGDGDVRSFEERVEKEVHKHTIAAVKGREIEISDTPF